MHTLVFDKTTPRDRYERLFTLSVGEVIKVLEGDYETFMERVQEYLPDSIEFEVFPITPGTDLYTMYGPNHCVVTKNQRK